MSSKFENFPIEIDGDGNSEYEQKIQEILKKILVNPIGRIILASLPKSKKIVIKPFKKNICSAKTTPWEIQRSFGFKDNFSVIEVSPDTFALGTDCNPTGDKRRFGVDQDEVLLHELVHASRQMNERFDDQKISKSEGFDYENIDDFWAITVANVYSSANGKTEFRLDHTQPPGKDKIPNDASTSNSFFSKNINFKWMQYFFVKENRLFMLIGQQRQVKFNPFFEFIKVKPSYRSFQY